MSGHHDDRIIASSPTARARYLVASYPIMQFFAVLSRRLV